MLKIKLARKLYNHITWLSKYYLYIETTKDYNLNSSVSQQLLRIKIRK